MTKEDKKALDSINKEHKLHFIEGATIAEMIIIGLAAIYMASKILPVLIK